MAPSARDSGRFPPLSQLAIVSLVLLRLAVGWHFFKEGATKLQNPSFSSQYFLQEAHGPWVTFFWSMMDDPLALKSFNEQEVRATWDAYFSRLQTAREADQEAQRKLAAAATKWKSVLDDYFRRLAADLAEYRAKAEPLALTMRNAKEQSQLFVNQRTRRRLAELQQARAPWLAELRRMEQLMQSEMDQLLGPAQSKGPSERLRREGKSWIDHAVTFTTLSVGVLLLIGLLVPVASLVGCGFLLSVMFTQPFWVAEANLTYSYYQLVEIAALLVLAATCAGRYAGLDFFWSAVKK